MDYDLSVIGAGWAGFNAAITAKDLGLKVCLIDKGPLGGVCLNYGCIPTKALIHCAKLYSLSVKSEIFGIKNMETRIDFSKMVARKNLVIKQLQSGIQFMLKGVDFINSRATLVSNQEIALEDKNITVKSIIIASGSRPLEIPDLKFGGNVISSNEILDLENIPKKLLIVGGGVIGCEFASLFSSLGTKVTIAEKLSRLLVSEDEEISRKIESVFKKKGIAVNINYQVKKEDADKYDLVLIAAGRLAVTDNLGLERIGLKLENNAIFIDEFSRTNLENIYASGDCTGKVMLANFAAHQGMVAANNIACPDKLKKIQYHNVASCIFTDPEAAGVGLSEEMAKEKGINFKVNKFYFLGSGLARITEETDGFVKILSNQTTGEVLGASIIGPRATELINILTLAVSARLKVSQVAGVVFAHPTFSESITDALKS